jgi:cell division protein FtsI/penicillin-binding protein 2
MLGRTDSRLRLIGLLVAVTIFAALLGVRLTYWQLGQGPELRQLAAAQLNQPDSEQIQRGAITDRHGTLLATTAYRDLLAAHPDLIPARHRADVARQLAALLNFGAGRTDELVTTFERGVPYVIVSRQLTLAQSGRVRQMVADGDLAALSLEPRPVRFYPNPGGSPSTTLASQLLGFVTEDGVGRYGVEQFSQALLAGDSGRTAAVGDGVELPTTGGGIQLTIDASLQLRLEKELYAAWVANRAERVSAVIVDPASGAILASASVPGYDANEYGPTARTSPDFFVDPITSQVYEPGSVMKMFTAAAALEMGVVNRATRINDTDVLKIGRNSVRNADLKGMGKIPFEDVIAFSRNVATGRVAMMLGETTGDAAGALYDLWDRLGIGRRSGVELSNESGGLVANPAERPWQPIDLVNRAFGQGVAVTPLQLAAGYSAMVNGGQLVHPHIVAAVNDEPRTPVAPEQVLDPALSAELRGLMMHVIESSPNYARETLIPGYAVGGKTGTAQIWDSEAGAWMDGVFNHTFCGFVAGEDSEVVIVVRIHETKPRVHRQWGMSLEQTSNELFRRVGEGAIAVLDMQPLPGHVQAGQDGREPVDGPEPVDQPAPADEASRQPQPTRP